jgi:hypothetical protein
MRIVSTVARILLGLAFFVFGLNGFLHFIPGQPPPGPAMTFMLTLAATHYYVVIFLVQVLGGALLLVNRFVPLALVVLAAVIVNILNFHATMMPAGLPGALVLVVCWLLVAIPLRAYFAPLLAPVARAAN